MNKRPYAGVLIFGFKDNVEHPIFRIGDIVIKMDGKQVKNYDALKAEFKQNENAIVTFLRPNGNSLSEERCQMDKSDIIGFINLQIKNILFYTLSPIQRAPHSYHEVRTSLNS